MSWRIMAASVSKDLPWQANEPFAHAETGAVDSTRFLACLLLPAPYSYP
jgi:hypothetical protein